jgi:phosphatidylglycerophosphatase A
MLEHHDDDTHLPGDDDEDFATDGSGDSIADTLRLMRVAQANGLFSDLASIAASLKGTLEKRVDLRNATLLDAAIDIIHQIKQLFKVMTVSDKTRKMVDETEAALVAMGIANYSKVEVRESTAAVLTAIITTFTATRFH